MSETSTRGYWAIRSPADVATLVVLGLVAAGILWWLVAWIMSGSGTGSSENLDDYSTCAQLATNPGTDYNTARCVENGDVISYKDSTYGKNVGRLAGQ